MYIIASVSMRMWLVSLKHSGMIGVGGSMTPPSKAFLFDTRAEAERFLEKRNMGDGWKVVSLEDAEYEYMLRMVD